MKIFFVFITAIHGAIHLMGFAKAFNYAEIKELTCPISRPAGSLWLACALLFIAAAFLMAAEHRYWWIAAAAGVFISQPLIISCFKDAKFGTIPNLIILAAAVTAYGVWNFDGHSRRELELLLNSARPEKIKISAESVAGLPLPIRKWIERSNITDKEISSVVYLSQRGELRTAPDGKWMPAAARQWIVSDKPGFLWKARIEAAPLVHISGCDKYYDGRGRMLIKLMSLFKIADSSGKQIDQGTLLRYMGESVWAPASLLNGLVKFEQIDDRRVRAVMNYGGVEADGVYEFDGSGDFISFAAKRYYDRSEGATLEDWLVTADSDGYREFGGIRVPAKLSVTWKLKSGDFTWYRLEIDRIEYGQSPEYYRSQISGSSID